MKSTPPTLSIIVPIYNVAPYLKQCVDSILEQSYADFELILVNDGSTDNSGDIVEHYAMTDVRVRAIHKPNGGYGSALNAGLSSSRGSYIGIVESDDYIDSRMYTRLMSVAATKGCDIARCGFVSFNESNETIDNRTLGDDLNSFNVVTFPEFLCTPPAIWSAVYRRRLISSNGIRAIDIFRLSFQDVDFFVRTSIAAESIVCIPECLYFYRINSQNSSSSNLEKVDDIFLCYELTDQFIEKAENLDEGILRNYRKRRICDLQWHFRRVSGRNKIKFAKKASESLRKILALDLIGLLNASQTIFLILMICAPTLFASYRILYARWTAKQLSNA